MRRRSAAELRGLVRIRDGDLCWICGTLIDFTRPAGTFMGPSLEHVTPRAAGGTNHLGNLRLTHAYPCNHAKAALSDVDWAALRDGDLTMAALSRYERRTAAAITQMRAMARNRVIHEGGRDRPPPRPRRSPSGPRPARGPWGGLIVVEERGPWGGIVRRNSGV
jgi:hypothetical protein